MKTYVASVSGNAVSAFRAEDDDQALAIIDDPEGSLRSDLEALVSADGKPLCDGKSERRRRHNIPNGSSLVTKQSATGKLTWMRATIRMSGTSIESACHD